MLAIITCYVCLLGRECFYLRYKDTAFFAGGQISAIDLTRFSARIDAIQQRAVGGVEITSLSKRLVEFVESVEFVETQTADFEQVIPFSTNSTNSTNGKKTGAFRYIIILVITLPNLIYNILRPHLSQIYLWNLWNLWKRSFLLMSQNVPRPIHRGFRH